MGEPSWRVCEGSSARELTGYLAQVLPHRLFNARDFQAAGLGIGDIPEISRDNRALRCNHDGSIGAVEPRQPPDVCGVENNQPRPTLSGNMVANKVDAVAKIHRCVNERLGRIHGRIVLIPDGAHASCVQLPADPAQCVAVAVCAATGDHVIDCRADHARGSPLLTRVNI